MSVINIELIIMNEIIPTPQEPRKQHKGGRPKMDAAEKREHIVKVGFDAENYKKLKRRSRKTGASLSSIVYELAVNGKIHEPLSHEMMDCIRKIAGMANNLNQLAHEAHIMGYAEVASGVQSLSAKIDEELVELYKLRNL